MKKRALAILMAALTASTMFAVPTFAADYSGEDPQLEKNIKILTIWAEDNDNGMLLNKICEDYQKNVNPNFTWEYEMVAAFGPATAKTVEDENLRLDLEAPSKKFPSMTGALKDYLERNNE